MNWDAYKLALLREMGLTAWVPREAVTEAPGQAGHEAPVVEDEAPLREPDRLPEPEPIAAPPASAAPRPPRSAPPASAPATLEGRRVVGIETMDWPELREAVVQCTACKLCKGRRQTVFGVGHEQADWMIVGEAPGEQEDLKGEPFVGPAGKLLDQMLRSIGLAREPGAPDGQVYIANVLKCRPPHNRNPEPEEVAQCEPFLRRQIELVRPRIILAMGRFAVQTLLQSQEAIGRLRGRVHRYEGIPVVVTYHPAYLLRNLPDKAKAWDDLCLAVQQLKQESASR